VKIVEVDADWPVVLIVVGLFLLWLYMQYGEPACQV
jgi:hypothetical protein